MRNELLEKKAIEFIGNFELETKKRISARTKHALKLRLKSWIDRRIETDYLLDYNGLDIPMAQLLDSAIIDVENGV